MKPIGLVFLSILFSAQASGACKDTDFIRSEANQVLISIQGRGYSPPCLIIRPGAEVTIQASTVHPLQGVENRNGPANPFFRANEAVSPETQVLTSPGSYQYFCTRHGDHHGNNMAGEIRVESF